MAVRGFRVGSRRYSSEEGYIRVGEWYSYDVFVAALMS